MKSFLIAPSLLAANFAILGQEAEAVMAAGADILHFDVMDNHFVPNLTMGPFICKALRDYGIQAPIDVHLMTKPVDSMIRMFAEAGASQISFHPEASDHIDRSLSLIRAYGCAAGIALNPATPLQVLDFIAEKLDFILVMAVNPGFGGQGFINAVLNKISLVRNWINAHRPDIDLFVDGGVKLDNIRDIKNAGANAFVCGTAIFNTNNYNNTIEQFRTILLEN